MVTYQIPTPTPTHQSPSSGPLVHLSKWQSALPRLRANRSSTLCVCVFNQKCVCGVTSVWLRLYVCAPLVLWPLSFQLLLFFSFFDLFRIASRIYACASLSVYAHLCVCVRGCVLWIAQCICIRIECLDYTSCHMAKFASTLHSSWSLPSAFHSFCVRETEGGQR